MATNERAFDNQQLLRARAIFEKLSQPSDDFYKEVRGKTTQQNIGNYYRKPGIAVMMPYQYYYHRFGDTKQNEYPAYICANASISQSLDCSTGVLNYFPDLPEDIEDIKDSYSLSSSKFKIIQQPNNISGAMLSSFERFADRIMAEWDSYQKNGTANSQDLPH